MISSMNYSINHVYRECNMAADWLANLGLKTGMCVIFSGDSMPSRLKSIARLDKCGFPYIRVGSDGVFSFFFIQ